ncbi:zinc-binding dehydrogenase [candidate division KSB1 bacterium]|nr:zinc-binding dehydrogenase [candidate division KSB1 bacterium]
MRQIVITKAGKPDVLQIREKDAPHAGKGELRIRVKAAGINFADILARKGLYPDAPKKPCVVGYEISGIVEAVGESVSANWIDKKVLSLVQFGGYSEIVTVPERQVFEMPSNLSFEQAAALPVNYLTAYQLLVVMGNLRRDESVLIHNAGGGVGLAALDIAKHIGATIFGTASFWKHEFLKNRGLQFAIDYRSQDWVREIKRLTNGRGVELVIDPIGGKHWQKSFRALRHTGRLGVFGISAATRSNFSEKLSLIKLVFQTPRFNPIGLMNRNKGIFGVHIGHLWHEQGKVLSWMNALLDGVRQGWVQPHVDRSFPFDKAAEAHEFIEARKNIGKAILVP